MELFIYQMYKLTYKLIYKPLIYKCVQTRLKKDH